jgi:hypothetical protein
MKTGWEKNRQRIAFESEKNRHRIGRESPKNRQRIGLDDSWLKLSCVPFQKASTKSSPSITYFQETSTRLLAFPKNIPPRPNVPEFIHSRRMTRRPGLPARRLPGFYFFSIQARIRETNFHGIRYAPKFTLVDTSPSPGITTKNTKPLPESTKTNIHGME